MLLNNKPIPSKLDGTRSHARTRSPSRTSSIQRKLEEAEGHCGEGGAVQTKGSKCRCLWKCSIGYPINTQSIPYRYPIYTHPGRGRGKGKGLPSHAGLRQGRAQRPGSACPRASSSLNRSLPPLRYACTVTASREMLATSHVHTDTPAGSRNAPPTWPLALPSCTDARRSEALRRAPGPPRLPA